jgi:hypothetical protein
MKSRGGCGCAEVFEGGEAWTRAWQRSSRAWDGLSGLHVWGIELPTFVGTGYKCGIFVSMSLVCASQRAVSRRTCLRSSYLGISHFFRTRHHGITPSSADAAKRSFSISRSLKDEIHPDEKLRTSLDEFKATSMCSVAAS